MDSTATQIPWGERPPREERQRVARALAEGRLVALPTETVYGIAARADDPRAVARLRALKGREGDRPLTWHVGEIPALARFGRVSPMAQRLIERYWPGPLTLVLPGVPSGLEAAAQEGWTGVRLPAHGGTAALLAELDFPVVASSANRAGEAPLQSAGAIAAAFGEALAFVLDGGPPRLNEPSVVLRLGPGRFELLRPGILELEQLREVAGLDIGFVCTGNTCRSPMAEGIARARTARALEVPAERLAEFGFSFRSMGLMASAGMPASEHAVQVLSLRGVDIAAHRAQPTVPGEVARLDRVYALTQGHLETLRLLLPPGRDRHCALLDPEGADVPDPIGGPYEEYQRTADHIERLIALRLDEWV